MNERRSEWQTKRLAAIFSDGVRGAIPAADLQLEVICQLISTWCPEPSRILDLGCGDGILGRMLLDAYPAAHIVFADFSEPMLDRVRTRLGKDTAATVIHADFATSTWVEHAGLNDPFDIVVSGFAIHHQPDARKRRLYSEIYERLNEGGLFLNLDQVSSATASLSQIFDDFFLDHMRRFHRQIGSDDAMENIEKAYYRDKRENIPAPVDDQCQWLRDIGFQEVDCYLKTFELALFGGTKRGC